MELHGLSSAVARVAGIAAVAGGAVVCTKLLVAVALATVTVSALGAILTAAGVGTVALSGWCVARAIAQRIRGSDPKSDAEQQNTDLEGKPQGLPSRSEADPEETPTHIAESSSVSASDAFKMQFPQHLCCDLSALRVGAMLYWVQQHMEGNPLQPTNLERGPHYIGALSVQRKWNQEERTPQEMLAQARLGAASRSPQPWKIDGIDSIIEQLPRNSQKTVLVWFEDRLPSLAIVLTGSDYEVFDPTRGSWQVPAQQMKCFLEGYSQMYVDGKSPISLWNLIRN